MKFLSPLFLLFIFTVNVFADNAFVQKVHKEPKNKNEDPEDYLQITIDGVNFRSTILSDWALLSNTFGMHVAALSSQGGMMVGVRVDRCTTPEGQSFSAFDQKIFDSLLKKLKPDGPRYEGENPVVPEGSTEINLTYKRIDDTQAYKCRYVLRIVDNQLWSFFCEAPTPNFDTALQTFSLLLGTFSKDITR